MRGVLRQWYRDTQLANIHLFRYNTGKCQKYLPRKEPP